MAFRLKLRYEARIPPEIIKADGYLGAAFRWLKDNGILMTAGDGSGTEKRIGKHHPFDFLGHARLFPLGPAILAGKTGAVIMPLFIVPGEKKLYKIIIERPLVSAKAGEGWILDITEQFIRRLEHYVSQFPYYMHFLDRLNKEDLTEHRALTSKVSLSAKKED